MTELKMIQKALTEAHELAHILIASPHLKIEDQVRVEKSIRTLLSLLYTRLNEIDVNQVKLPANIKSDY